MSHIVYIGIGSNLGDREGNIGRAIGLLEGNPDIQIIKASSLYETEPVGYKEQGDFLNAVIEISTSLGSRDLLKIIKNITNSINTKPKERWGPRSIDLDILFYDDLVIQEEDLAIPHPRLHDRGFVLVPLVEIAPDLIHPVLKISVKKLLDRLEDRSWVVKYDQNAERTSLKA